MRDFLLQHLLPSRATGSSASRARSQAARAVDRLHGGGVSRSERGLRRTLSERLAQGSDLAVLLIRIERIDTLREALGPDIALRVMERCLDRLSRECGEDGRVAAGEDGELMLIEVGLDGLSGQRRMERVLRELQRPIDTDGITIAPRVAIGAAYTPTHGSAADALIRRARIARSDARGRFVPLGCYELGSEERWTSQLALLAELRRAIEGDELELHFQPKVRSARADERPQVVGAEALVRWRHPERGLIPPDDFIPLAETSGVIVELGERVLTLAVDQLALWRDAGIELELSVNLSARDIEAANLVERIAGRLEAARLDPHCLMIEVTESATMRDPELASEVLQRLRGTGVRVSLDDFGTGESSLSKLRDLPVDELKIDRAFITPLAANSIEATIVGAIVQLGHAAGCSVVAEGVETAEQQDLLTALGADLIQGWAIARAMPIEAFECWCTAQKSLPEATRENRLVLPAAPGDPEGWTQAA